jgi:hypothetical protein
MAVKNKQPLSTTHPELAAQAHGWDPTTVTAGSNMRVSWKCPLDHLWEAVIAKRSLSGRNCPYCSNQAVLAGFNDLATTHPQLAAQAHGWDPRSVTAGSGTVREWKCQHGHIWRTTIGNRSSQETGCPTCSNRVVLDGFNDLATTHPQLAAQAHGWDPRSVTAGSGTVREWKCQYGHIWKAQLVKRSDRGSGCPICSGHQVLAGFNDLATHNPELASQAWNWDPKTVTAGSSRKLEWQCEHGHNWIASVNGRSSGKGCPICAGKQIKIGFNDLATTHPQLAAQAHGWDPTTVTFGNGSKRRWKCDEGHTWTATANSRSNAESGCPSCAGRQVLAGFNDLATTHPELAAQAHGWNPTTVTAGSGTVREWKCQHGHIWRTTIGNRSAQETSCPICSNKKVLSGFNDLATTHPELAAQAHGWDPTTVTFGNGSKRRWKCDEGHTWTATANSRSNAESGCPSCANTGFDPNQPGWIYLVRREHDDLLQIGISNFPESRLESHARRGWSPIDLIGPIDGATAREIEQALLRYLNAKSIPRANSFSDRFDGYTETWRCDDFSVSSLAEIRDLIRDWESE